jgi:DNA-binding LacI/PurR family transcriptional regulator
MAAKAVQLLVARLRGEQDIPVTVLIRSELVLRETTSPV